MNYGPQVATVYKCSVFRPCVYLLNFFICLHVTRAALRSEEERSVEEGGEEKGRKEGGHQIWTTCGQKFIAVFGLSVIGLRGPSLGETNSAKWA